MVPEANSPGLLSPEGLNFAKWADIHPEMSLELFPKQAVNARAGRHAKAFHQDGNHPRRARFSAKAFHIDLH